MEGIERTNAVIVRGSGQGARPRQNPYAMEIDRGRNCYDCGVLGTWPIIAGIREAEWLRGEGWNMEEEESREILNIQTI